MAIPQVYNTMSWYLERNRLAIVSADSGVDGGVINIPVGSKVRIYGAKIADPFSASNDSLTELAEQFHEAIEAKKWKKSGRLGGFGQLVPRDF